MPEPNRVFLLPGESTYARKHTDISTLLGSCVAVCLYDPATRGGGMNHFVLPTCNNTSLSAGKYGDESTDALIKVATAAGARPRDLLASIYGGGHVIGHLNSAKMAGIIDVGAKNIAMARGILKSRGIKIVREDVGKDVGRRIHMDTDTNEIACRSFETSAESKARAKTQARLGSRKIRTLVVDDSATVRRLIGAGIEASPDIEVVGEAANPYEARKLLLELDPDVICLDIIMPRMDGLSFLKKIMQYKPVPTIIVSTIAKKGSEMRAKVLEAGAVGVVDKEDLDLYRRKEAVAETLLPLLRKAAMSTVGKGS